MRGAVGNHCPYRDPRRRSRLFSSSIGVLIVRRHDKVVVTVFGVYRSGQIESRVAAISASGSVSFGCG